MKHGLIRVNQEFTFYFYAGEKYTRIRIKRKFEKRHALTDGS